MVSETPNQTEIAGTSSSSSLLPDRHPQYDLFICDVSDAVLKDVIPQMEHPFYALTKRPDTAIRRYEHNGQWLQITPSVKGLATIYDKDILIYCISQLMAKLKAGEAVSKRVQINSRDLLIFANRGTSGKDYEALQEAIERIRGTTISTNIRTGDEEQVDTFGLIDASSFRRTQGLDGRLISCEITLSDWVFNAIRSNEVLTLHRDYFRLRRPIERRIYEITRKHCGQQLSWKISVELLLKKTGSKASEKEFRRSLRELAQSDHLPDYQVEFQEKEGRVLFQNRGTMAAAAARAAEALSLEPWAGRLDPEVYEDARASAPGWDVHHLEAQWRHWLGENEIVPRAPERHFVKFCLSWYEKRGRP